MDIYAQNILERYKNPFHKDKSIDPTISHTEANHSCGDKITIHLKTDNNALSDYTFEGAGCAISMAAADMLGDLIEGMSLQAILDLKKEDVYQTLGIEISVRRSKCALLPLLCLQNTILTHQSKDKKGWIDYHID